jgi:F420-0:gamma-glutamyl ligase
MSTAPTKLTLSVVPGIPLVGQGDDLGTILIQAIERSHLILRPGDILVVAQKVVSKAQGRYVDLDSIEPSARAKKLAVAVNKDPRLVEVILSESIRVVRQYPNVLIVEQRSGFIFSALRDLRGRQDLFGRLLETSRTAMADEVASAASLLMGEADEGYRVILVSGFDPDELHVPANALIRPASEDLFR